MPITGFWLAIVCVDHVGIGACRPHVECQLSTMHWRTQKLAGTSTCISILAPHSHDLLSSLLL